MLDALIGMAAPETKPSKAKHETFQIEDNGKINKFLQISEDIDGLTAIKKTLEDDLKSIGKRLFTEQYTAKGKRPANFFMEGEGARIMFMAVAKYGKVTEEKQKAMQAAGLGGLVQKKVTLMLNPDVVEKYATKIAAALKTIEVDPGDQLLTVQQDCMVKSDALESLAGLDVSKAIAIIEPQFSLKRST